MADESSGGVVTTVKEETTKDLDVVEHLRVANEGVEPVKDPPKPKAKVEKQLDNDDDDEYVPLDFNSLDEKQQKAVARVYKDRRETRKELQSLRGQLDDMRRELAGKKPEEPVKIAAVVQSERPKPPDAKNYSGADAQAKYDADYLEYEDKLYEFRKAADRQRDAVDAQAKKDKEILDKFAADAKAFEVEHKNYRDVIDNDEPMTNTMFGACVDKGPELLYYLGTHRQEARKIYAMGDGPQAVEALLRIAIKLEMQKEAALKSDEDGKGKKKIEQPEMPPTPVGARGGGPAPQKDKARMSFKEREQEEFKRNPGKFSYKP